MMKGVQLKGLDKLIQQMDRGTKSNQHLARAVYAEATTVLNESKKIVPVDDGYLKNSGKVEPPHITARETSVEVTYGGAAAPYALYVHEDPEARHAAGKTFKYLEIPALAHANKFADGVKERLFSYIRGGH
jgi:hypothetical protein